MLGLVGCAPAAILISKVMYPEDGEPETKGTLKADVPSPDVNVIDAAATGEPGVEARLEPIDGVRAYARLLGEPAPVEVIEKKAFRDPFAASPACAGLPARRSIERDSEPGAAAWSATTTPEPSRSIARIAPWSKPDRAPASPREKAPIASSPESCALFRVNIA